MLRNKEWIFILVPADFTHSNKMVIALKRFQFWYALNAYFCVVPDQIAVEVLFGNYLTANRLHHIFNFYKKKNIL